MPLDIAALAAAKQLPAASLRSYGLRDRLEGGVRIEYAAPGGGPARARIRREMTGPAGSAWAEGTEPIGAYWRPLVPALVDRHGLLLLCEGESSCWTCWHHGLGAVGLPGADQADTLGAEHLAGAPVVAVVLEPDEPGTYPAGAAAYRDAVLERLAAVGRHDGVVVLDLTGVAAELNEIHRRDPDGYVAAVLGLVRHQSLREG